MAIFGNLENIISQVQDKKFNKAFSYLMRILEDNSLDNKRLLSLPINSFEKLKLDENNFALEQVYNSKERNECFFESHKDYIDVQFILDGVEIIEVVNIDDLVETSNYDKNMDLIKYKDNKNSSSLILKKGDVAIFYPKDGHMPCVKLNQSLKVVKTVVKVEV